MTPSQDSQGRYIPPEETLTAGVLASASRTTSFEFSVTPVTVNRDN